MTDDEYEVAYEVFSDFKDKVKTLLKEMVTDNKKLSKNQKEKIYDFVHDMKAQGYKVITEEEIEEAYEKVDAFFEAVLELRSKMLDDKLTDEQLDYVADYINDNFRIN